GVPRHTEELSTLTQHTVGRQRLGWAKPTGRANARPMIDPACPPKHLTNELVGRERTARLCPPYEIATGVALSRTACLVSLTISSSMASPASTNSSSVTRRVTRLRCEAPSRFSGGTCTNAARRGPASADVASIARQLR